MGNGEVTINFFSNGQLFQIMLQDVYHIPNAKFELISVSHLANQGYSVEFKSDTGQVRLNGHGINAIIGHLNDQNLYSIKEAKTKHIKKMGFTNAVAGTRDTIFHCDLNYLHKMLAHKNKVAIKEMISKGQLGGVNITDMTWKGCDACDRAKGGRTPIAKESHANINGHGFIVGDVMDMLERCYGNFKYVSTFIDVATRYCGVELLITKDRHSIVNHFRKFRNMMLTQANDTV